MNTVWHPLILRKMPKEVFVVKKDKLGSLWGNKRFGCWMHRLLEFFLNNVFYLEKKRSLSLNYFCKKEILKEFFRRSSMRWWPLIPVLRRRRRQEERGVIIYSHETLHTKQAHHNKRYFFPVFHYTLSLMRETYQFFYSSLFLFNFWCLYYPFPNSFLSSVFK